MNLPLHAIKIANLEQRPAKLEKAVEAERDPDEQ